MPFLCPLSLQTSLLDLKLPLVNDFHGMTCRPHLPCTDSTRLCMRIETYCPGKGIWGLWPDSLLVGNTVSVYKLDQGRTPSCPSDACQAVFHSVYLEWPWIQGGSQESFSKGQRKIGVLHTRILGYRRVWPVGVEVGSQETIPSGELLSGQALSLWLTGCLSFSVETGTSVILPSRSSWGKWRSRGCGTSSDRSKRRQAVRSPPGPDPPAPSSRL